MNSYAKAMVATALVAGSSVASAATWSYYAGGDVGFSALTQAGALERATAEGRIGNNIATGQWESAILKQGVLQTQDQFVFGNAQATSFSIVFDGVSSLTFNLGSTTQTWSGITTGFSDIFLRVQASATSSLLLSDLNLSGLAIGDLSQGTAGNSYIRITNGSDFGAFTLSGTATLAWSGAAPTGSNLGFQTRFARVIPAPGSVAVLGLAGLTAGRRRR